MPEKKFEAPVDPDVAFYKTERRNIILSTTAGKILLPGEEPPWRILKITPDMLDASGVVQGVDFGRSDVTSIVVHRNIQTVIIDQSLDLPSVSFNINGATDIQICGDARLLRVMIDSDDACKLTVHGNLTVVKNVRVFGTLHVTGSIDVTEDIWAAGSIRSNGSITAKFIRAYEDIFVDGAINAPGGIACHDLTIYSDQPRPKFTSPMVYD